MSSVRASKKGDPAVTAAHAANNSAIFNSSQNGGSGNSSVSMEAFVRSPITSASDFRNPPIDYGGSSPTTRNQPQTAASTSTSASSQVIRSNGPNRGGGGGGQGQHTYGSGGNNWGGLPASYDNYNDDDTAQRFSATSSAKTLERLQQGSSGNSGRYNSSGNSNAANHAGSNYYHPNAYMAQNASQHPGSLLDGQLAAAVPLRPEDATRYGGGNHNAGMLPSSTAGSSLANISSSDNLPSCAILLFQVLLLIMSSVVFTFGVTGTADRLTGVEGWDEVFTVMGMLFIFPILLFLYRLVSPLIPKFQQRTENTMWYWLLRGVLVISFIVQSVLFMLYLVKYNDKWYMFFIIPDVLIVLMMLVSTRLTTLWSFLYVIVTTLKMGLFWFNLDPANGQKNAFVEKGNVFGINGFLAVLMLILPMIHYPVIISRLEAGMTMTDAYTTNMAAVFAHILHVMDSLELYMQGQDRRALSATVQYLLLLFALMGFVACSIYYITLFFKDEESENIIRRFQSNALGDIETTKDESLLHYFLWSMIFIDLPYGCMRFVAFLVHNDNTILSPFFAKNIAMIGYVMMLLFYNNYQRTKRVGDSK